MIDAISVLTCPFWLNPNDPPLSPRLKATLENLDRAGADRASDKVVFCDGPFPPDPIKASTEGRPWRVVSNDKGPSGTTGGFWTVFEAMSGVCDRLMFFEDDVFVCKGTIKRMQDIGDLGLALVRYYDTAEWPAGTPSGIYESPGNGRCPLGLIGLQGVLIPSRTLALLAANGPKSRQSTRPADLVLGDILHAHGLRVATHLPSLVQHEGVISRTGAGPHTALNFAGYDYEA